MTPRLEWEAEACTDDACGSTRIHKLHGDPVFVDGDPCPRCSGPMKVVRNKTFVASIVLATNGDRGPLRAIRKQR